MSYKILSASQADDILNTEVEYTINGQKLTVLVAHFRPTSEAEITVGIQNRELSEKAKLDAQAAIQALIPQIEIG